MAPTEGLPVFFLLEERACDLPRLTEALRGLGGAQQWVLLYDLEFHHQAAEVRAVCEDAGVVMAQLCFPGQALEDSSEVVNGFRVSRALHLDACGFVYVGNREAVLTALSLDFSQNRVVCVDPLRDFVLEEASVAVNRILKRRYYLMEKTKDSECIGIVMGTLGVDKRLAVLKKLQQIITEAGKRYYTILIGRINDPKLANFTAIDIFVHIACPQTVMVDTYHYVKDVVTPVELQLALERGSLLDYSTKLENVLETESFSPMDREEALDSPRFSIVTGKLIHNVRDALEQGCSREVGLYNDGKLVSADRLSSQMFRGLDARIGQDAPSELRLGRRGIARSYDQIETEQV